MGQAFLEVENLTVTYTADKASVTALDNVSFSVEKGSTLGIIGESGSGKTSTGMALMGLLGKSALVSGSVRYCEKDLQKLSDKERNQYRWRNIAIVFQNSLDVLNPVLTVYEQIFECLNKHTTLNPGKSREKINKLLQIVGLDPSWQEYYPHQLSGGIRQRVLLAMALSCEPDVLIVDEPTNAVSNGAPADLIKSVLYHDHFCPGVSSGYLLANFLERELPLRSPNEAYFIVSAPVWCKEDALQTVLNTTPGKSGMAILPLDEQSKKRLLPAAKNLAGIYFRTDRVTKKGEALVLAFDFSKAAELIGLDKQPNVSDLEKRVRTIRCMIANQDRPELFITVLKHFELKEGQTPLSYVQPGDNILIRLELAQ